MTLHMLTYGNCDEGLVVVNDDGRVGRLNSIQPLMVSTGWGEYLKGEKIVEGSGWNSIVLCDGCQNLIYRAIESISTGYGTNDKGQHFCYVCCAKEDRRIMQENGKYWLYLVEKDGRYELHNWPGSLVIKNVQLTTWNQRRKRWNPSDIRTFTFTFEGQRWYGRNSGDTQVAWVKRYKEKK